MEEKKKIKLNLSAIVIFILIAIIIGMGFYKYKLNKDKYYMTIGASQQIEELNNKINNLEENIDLENKKEEENDLYYNDIKFDNNYFIENGQITKIDEDTKQFYSKELGLSFQYPNYFEIEYTDYDIIRLKPISDNSLVEIGIGTKKESYSEWLSIYKDDPWAIEVVNEGDIKVSNNDAHYFRCNVGNGLDDYKTKDIFIKIDNNQGFKTGFSVGLGDFGNDLEIIDWKKVSERQDEKYIEYEPIFDNIISTLKFEK